MKISKLSLWFSIAICLGACTKLSNSKKNDDKGVFQVCIDYGCNNPKKTENCGDAIAWTQYDASVGGQLIWIQGNFPDNTAIALSLVWNGNPSQQTFNLDQDGINGSNWGYATYWPKFGNTESYVTIEDGTGTATITGYDETNQRVSGTFSFKGKYFNGTDFENSYKEFSGSFENIPIITDPNNPQLPCAGGGGGTGGSSNTGNNGGNSGGNNNNANGQAMFWTASDLGCGNIGVTCGGITKDITGFYSTGTPACGAANNPTFDLAPGNYNYSASCSGLTWSGTVTVTKNGCTKIQLTKSGNTGTGSGAFNSQATVTFWIASDLGCGNINVTCGGSTQSISNYYTNGAPACAASGTASFVLPAGNSYTYSASCSGLTWSGTINTPLSGDPCVKIQLTK